MDSFSLLNYWRGPGATALAAHSRTTPPSLLPIPDLLDDDEDDSSLFDLEFTLPNEVEDDSSADDSDEQVFDLAVSSSENASDATHHFFKHPAGIAFAAEPDAKPALFPAALIKSATKLRVLMLAFKKPRSAVAGNAAADPAPASPKRNKYLVKFKVEELSIMSRDAVLRYLGKIKPLYIKVSRRPVEKRNIAGEGVDESSALPAGLRVVCKRLGKSKSASTAAPAGSPTRGRDDSAMQQEDGIQSAIAHCKRSFNSARGSESPLVRSMSDPCKTSS